MKLCKAIITLICTMMIVATETRADETSISIGIQSLSNKEHPRLMMDNETLEKLKQKISGEGNEVIKAMNGIIMSSAETILETEGPLRYQKDVSGKRILEVSRAFLYRISTCSYAYKMTGDKRFFEFVEKDINNACSFPDWNHPHFLDAAEMALAVSIGYDWLFDELSAQTKSLAETKLNEYAFKTALAKPEPWFYRSENNWNQVCNGGLTAAAVAICDKYPETAETIIRKAIITNRQPMKAMYYPDGNYSEGYSYWKYGTAYQVILLKILEDSFGTDFGLSDSQGFLLTADYMLFMVGVDGIFNYSDCGSSIKPSVAMWYFADKLNRPELLFNEVNALNKGLFVDYEDARVFPLMMSFAANIELDEISAPKENYWHGSGLNPVAFVRKDWSGTRSDAYLAVKAGKASNSHGHMDVGSFVYDAYGVRWALDLGMQTYAPLEKAVKAEGGNIWNLGQKSWRWRVARYNNLHHSTITIDDAMHNVDGVGVVKEFINNKAEKGMALDMTEVLKDQVKKAERKVVMLKNGSLKVTDMIEAPTDKDITYTWRMVTGTEPVVKKGCIILTSGKEKMILRANADVPVEYCIWSGAPKEKWDAPNPGVSIVGIKATIRKGESKIFDVTLSRP